MKKCTRSPSAVFDLAGRVIVAGSFGAGRGLGVAELGDAALCRIVWFVLAHLDAVAGDRVEEPGGRRRGRGRRGRGPASGKRACSTPGWVELSVLSTRS